MYIMFRKYYHVLAMMIVLLMSSRSLSAETMISIGGTGSGLGPMKILAAVFERSHPDIRIKIYLNMGSSGGIKAVAESSIDVAISSRSLNDTERNAGLVSIQYAKTPFVPVVNKNIEVSDLTTEDLVRIYLGQKQAWPDGKQIRLILRPPYDTDTDILKKMSHDMDRAVETALSREGMIVASTDQENADIIERTPGAIGFSTLSQVISEMRTMKVLTYNGVPPSFKDHPFKWYPVYKTFFLVTRTAPSAHVLEFIRFIASEQGRKILEESGNIVIMDTFKQ